MASSHPPERARFFGAREHSGAPPIHAVERDDQVTLCGLPVDAAIGSIGTAAPFMNARAIAEMLAAEVPPCETCRRLAMEAEGDREH